ncbi:ParA family protein [Exilibacterium tricleocarpae]|nr:ParA family protein [Exilibacterium tricleocarpae]
MKCRHSVMDAGPALPPVPPVYQPDTGNLVYARDLSTTPLATGPDPLAAPAPGRAVAASTRVTSVAGRDDCRRFLVLNGKGGCGKTTISTNLASYFAVQGLKTAIMDYDPQESSLTWLKLRDAESRTAPSIHGIAAHPSAGGSVTRSWQLRIPHGTQRVVIDAPAGVDGAELIGLLKNVDAVVIPVLPSSIDMHATARFIRDLLLIGKVRTRNIPVGIVANRVPKKTQAYKKLQSFLGALNIPFVVQFKDNPNYLNAAEIGLGIHELQSGSGGYEAEQWDKLSSWLEEATKDRRSLRHGGQR